MMVCEGCSALCKYPVQDVRFLLRDAINTKPSTIQVLLGLPERSRNDDSITRCTSP